ncbi:MAG: molybdopterin-dependent oxidoreductase [SAR324 cluster bacterium]|nr:molybdopterin-dependent oxidoreductase [SAR324 cluster bacterium]
MKLTRVTEVDGHKAGPALLGRLNPLVGRRGFLSAAGLGVGLAALGPSLVNEAKAAGTMIKDPRKLKQIKTICGNCAVGCGFIGEVENGVWVSIEPWFEHPINQGSLCSKGAAAREHVISEKRLRHPMKLEGGKWKRISWDTAMGEITDKLKEIRQKYGPDSLMILGSAHHTNEASYALRKFAAFWGSNNIDHQARICHSTTVAGLANVWGYGAMTNSMNDIRNSKSVLIIGENVCTSHPIAMQHILTAKEVNGAQVIVVEPRFSQTAAFADKFVRLRSGTDVAFIYGLVNIILKNGWEDKKMIRDRTYGFSNLKKELKRYSPKKVSNITGVSVKDLERVAKLLADNRPGTVIWAMGGTQHTNGTSVTRSYCVLQLVLGNMGVPGGGANVFRGHDNVQGATDLGVLSNTLPGYYGLSPNKAFKHWANVWNVDHKWIKSRFKNEKMNGKVGFTVARWYEGVIMDKKELGQDENLHAVFYWGHSSNCESQMDRIKTALDKVELLVDIDPFVTTTTVLPDRQDGVYMLPAATVYEQSASVTNSNRDIQWRNEIVKPVHESRTDLAIVIDLAERLGFGDKFKQSKNGKWKNLPEDVVAEWNLGMRTIGMVGQTVSRMKRQQEWAHAFNINTKTAEGGPVDGEQWGLPWPCWTEKHPGTHILYRTSIPVAKGGLGFRARWGPKAPDGRTLLAGKGSAPTRSSIRGGYKEFANWKTDLTGKVFEDAIAKGLAPYGNGRARFNVWQFAKKGGDDVPKHHEPIHSPRPDLLTEWVTYDDVKDHYRVPTLYKSLQKADWVKKYPIILSTGRQVEFEGGGNSERNCWWLVELQPEMYVEMHPKLANDHRVRHGDMVWVESPEDLEDKPSKIKVKVKVTRRVTPDMVYLPFHWGGVFEGKDLSSKYPSGYIPYGMGESANTVTNYGYDRITQMQETKTGLCRIIKA